MLETDPAAPPMTAWPPAARKIVEPPFNPVDSCLGAGPAAALAGGGALPYGPCDFLRSDR